MAADAAGNEVPALSVAGAARGLGVAPATLRSWERRYGLAPSLHTPGGHRRYGPEDLARLKVMNRLIRDGVPPAEAARLAIRTPIEPVSDLSGASGATLSLVGERAPGPAGPGSTGIDGEDVAPETRADPTDRPGTVQAGPAPGADDARGGWAADASDRASGQPEGARAEGPEPSTRLASSGGGRVLPMPRGTRTAKGLARSAMALDAHACRRAVEGALASRGALETWEQLVRPVLVAVGDRWAQTGRGVEVEHSFSLVVAGAMGSHAALLSRARNERPVLLASVPGELHDLPLMALHAALADEGIRSHVLGARTPDEALHDAVLRLGPPVVFLWSQMSRDTAVDLPAMRPAPVLALGGPGWGHVPDGAAVVEDLGGAVATVCAALGL
jgi:DNA-binding transcriptional MerR regulator/methanogenic corrinoid protein MtbC1